jgi:glycosyltransferase involved in cell wall biosynthesis
MTQLMDMIETPRKKVIIFITKSNWGGAQKYVFDIATHLPKDQFDVVVALGGNGLLRTRLVENGVRIIPLDGLERDVSVTKDIKVFFRMIKILRNEKPDIIHVNSTKISGIGAVAGQLTGVKNIIFTVHGWAFNEPRGFVSKSIIKFLYLVMLWLSDNVIAVSHKIVEQVTGWPFRKNTLSVVHNGIQAPHFLDKEHAREKLEAILNTTFSSDTLICGSIGELHPIKGHTYAIQAMEKISEERPKLKISYIIIGAGELENKLKEEIKTRGLDKKVFLTGYLQDASTYLKAFDYYLFPSLSEGLPYAIVEAGFAELPVIASNVGGIPEVITSDVEGILVPSMNSEAIHDAVCAYIDNPNQAGVYAKSLHKKVTREYSLEHMIEQTVAVYKK